MKKLFIVLSIICITQGLAFAYQDMNDFNQKNQNYARPSYNFQDNNNGFNNYQKYNYDKQYNDFNNRANTINRNFQRNYNNFNNRNYSY